jgi:hypothetical protein
MTVGEHHDATVGPVRTTVNLDDDVSAAVERLRRDQGLGLSEAVNELVRRGLAASPAPAPYVQRTASLGMRIDVANIGEVLELLDETDDVHAVPAERGRA